MRLEGRAEPHAHAFEPVKRICRFTSDARQNRAVAEAAPGSKRIGNKRLNRIDKAEPS